MRYRVTIEADTIELTDKVETFYEVEIKPHGNSARAGVPKKHVGKRAYVIILKD